ncbi:uncharacterized protein LOC116703470 isoform X3 [Etheostoma spectabile]|uniref:uncharacterized protein LOC116703470 isoform X2 n=1 Tax=Etheostoma spectabile TaxID=54343 RepID=UPI0013AF3C8B|nr:uncharacterized protein LOC116703470 isoform X2 [Etheostoma spectabile]XP_032394133.1 uncharacterized protein LOC116703470 isoform X3 [Etheostoma spectabile]
MEEEMAKNKAKINSSVSLAPPQTRSHRSRKRACPSDEVSEIEDIQAALHPQNTEGANTAVDAALLQGHQPLLQDSIMVSTQQHEAEEQSCLTKQDTDTHQKCTDATDVYLNGTGKAFEEQEETSVTYPNNDSQPEGLSVHADNGATRSAKGMDEMTAEECSRSPSQTCTDQLEVLLPISEEGDGTAMEEQLVAEDNSKYNLEKNQETSRGEPSNVQMADVKEITKDAAVGLPAKKKRRMGMCGLTERERSHFLQTQKRENGQSGPERAEKQICNDTADHVAPEKIVSSTPVGSVTEQSEAEIKLQPSHCEKDDRAETEVHIAVPTSDGTGTVCDPGCEVEGGIVLDPEQTGDTKSDSPAEELFVNLEQQELEGCTAEIVAKKPQEQIKDGEDGSALVDKSPAFTFDSNPTQNQETENRDAIEAALLQVKIATKAKDEKEESAVDAGDSDGPEADASFPDTRSAESNAGELCKAAVTPSGSERKDSGDSDDKPEPPQTRDNADPFGSGYLDYVSDSQLNTIVLTEVMEKEDDLGYPDCQEDATDLICGLVRELSSLNRKVMATHRELENLRRSSKASRSSIR